MKRLLRALFVCPLILVSAGSLAAQDKLKETPYFPLQVGTVWHYRCGETKFTVRVAKHEKIGDTLCALLETSRDGKVVGSEHLAVTADGVYRQDVTAPGSDKAAGKMVTQTFKPPILVLKLPPKKGDNWKIDSTSDGKAYRGAFQIDEQDVKVPASTYKTMRVSSKDLEVNAMKTNITTHYAEGVGPVKQLIESSGAKLEIELEKFESGK